MCEFWIAFIDPGFRVSKITWSLNFGWLVGGTIGLENWEEAGVRSSRPSITHNLDGCGWQKNKDTWGRNSWVHPTPLHADINAAAGLPVAYTSWAWPAILVRPLCAHQTGMQELDTTRLLIGQFCWHTWNWISRVWRVQWSSSVGWKMWTFPFTSANNEGGKSAACLFSWREKHNFGSLILESR